MIRISGFLALVVSLLVSTLFAGDTLQYTTWYDNSDKNPAHLAPKKTVRCGSQTYDEMMLYVEFYVPVKAKKPKEDKSNP
ncbi:MAG TPA: hypothetical protein PLN21_13765 [Gemmatales bacterium]|nr:hypothetical protein [Gemmatales bacterium]